MFNASALDLEEDSLPPTYKQVFDSHSLHSHDSSINEDIYEEIPDFQYVCVEYDLAASNENTLGVQKGQVLMLVQKHDLQGNDEWWLVRDREGHEGYVPANYLKQYN